MLQQVFNRIHSPQFERLWGDRFLQFSTNSMRPYAMSGHYPVLHNMSLGPPCAGWGGLRLHLYVPWHAALRLLVGLYGVLFKLCFLASGEVNNLNSVSRFAIEDLSSGFIIRRGIVDSRGTLQNTLILASGTSYREWIFDPTTGNIGTIDFRTPDPGMKFTIPPVLMEEPFGPDSDEDGLSDEAEFIVGTRPDDPDSDRDGIKDGAEIQQGLDPLDGLSVRVGISAAADTPGNAIDICGFNDVVIVADLQRGISVFNVFNRMEPLIIGQIETPGAATAVACAGNLVSVACEEQGLVVVDISDPPSARISRQVLLGAKAVCVAQAASIAYVGLESSEVVSVDMEKGTVLDRVFVGRPLQDLVLVGDWLYALTDSSLVALPIEGSSLRVETSVQIVGTQSAFRRRLAVGLNNLLYATHAQGYHVIQRGENGQTSVLGDYISQQFYWKQVAETGSGFLLAAHVVGTTQQKPDLFLYNVGPEGTNYSRFVIPFETPDLARALTLYNGLGYVADNFSGLVVVNYQPYDSGTNAPRVTLKTSFVQTSASQGFAEEGKLARLTADVQDDVQVRNVEFYLDGKKVATDGSFPFEFRFVTPLRSLQPSFRLSARASDTGGNFSVTPDLVVDLGPDADPPGVRATFPRGGGIVGAVQSILISFNEPIDPSSIESRALQLIHSGSNGVLGDGDDMVIKLGALTYNAELRAIQVSLVSSLPPGNVEMSIGAPIKDLAGNAMITPFRWRFSVLGGKDTDQDGLPDDIELVLGLDPKKPSTLEDGIIDGNRDFDADGLPTAWEIRFGYDPRVADTDSNGIADRFEDPDFDGLTNFEEFRSRTSPVMVDSDGDGWDDRTELTDGSDPASSSSGARNIVTVTASSVSFLNTELDQLPGSITVEVFSPSVSYENKP